MTTVVAHRGFAGANPENTVAAVRSAAAHADRVEVDVTACADGTPVVFHDSRLDDRGESRGITDGTGAVRELPPETVTAATVCPSDEQVPTLSDLCEATAVPLDVELKHPGAGTRHRGSLPPADRDAARERWAPFVDRVRGAVGDRDVRISSFYEGALAAVRAEGPDARLAALCRDLPTGRTLADRYDAEAIHASLSAVRDADLSAVDRTVNVWTVRTWQEAVAAGTAGADGLIADYPGLASRA
ncbi:glycerophosphodiester phosphodiesterase [Haloplanus salilacus]|uniref:glycerophosphodiester phosphodiesterase n=1 Tax=Haloplanus salilacus TaxID=2949994 RepID=UPI0030D463E6